MAKKAIGLCGSLRADSWNLKLLRNFFVAMEKEGGYTGQIWKSLEMPLMNEDLERAPLDERILRYREALKEASIVVVASPEYNSGYSPPLKNAIDWASRPPENLWAGKVVVLLSASPGALGGARGLIQVRSVLSSIKAWVLPEQVQCPLADKAFDAEGRLVNEFVQKQIAGSLASLKVFSDRWLEVK